MKLLRSGRLKRIWRKSAKRLGFGVVKKIAVVVLLVGLNWAGIAAIGQTAGYFNDNENSSGNEFSAAILDLTVRSGQGNFVPSADNMMPGQQVNRDIYVGKTALSLPLKHNVSFEFVDGHSALCDELDLKIWYNHYHGPKSGGYANRDMRLTYDGKLSALSDYGHVDFEIPHPDDQFDDDPSDGTEQWFYYSIILPSGIADDFQGEVCDFNFAFNAWQNDFSYSSGGFTDTEKLGSTIGVGYWNPPVVLNEFLPNPVGNESSLSKPNGEWVELYNLTSGPLDLGGYYLEDEIHNPGQGHRIYVENCRTNTGNTIIGPHGFLVVYTRAEDGCNDNGFNLDNDIDEVALFSPSGGILDSHYYNGRDVCNLTPTPGSGNQDDSSGPCSGDMPENKSIARIPDGTGPWYDPIPTPGGPNVLEEEQEPIIDLQNENQNASPSFSETLGAAAGAITEFVLGEEEVVASASGFGELTAGAETTVDVPDLAPVASESVEPSAELSPESTPESSLELSPEPSETPEPSVTPESAITPEPTDNPQPQAGDESLIQTVTEPAIPVEPVTVETPTEPAPPPADPPAPEQAPAPAPEAPAAPAE